MTYCVALKLNKGLVYLADTRTNAGVDNISTFEKLTVWEKPGERVLTMMTAGNLATTQAVISILDERNKAPEERDPSILKAPSMFQAARLVGEALKSVINGAAMDNGQNASNFGASIILGGQIAGSAPRLFMVYPEGNFIEASKDTPYLQIGETKYGKPILVRAFEEDMSFEDACKLLMVSMDSTLKANLSVGMPLDMQVYERDSFTEGRRMRITATDPYFNMISDNWGEALRQAFYSLPPFSFEDD